MKQSSLEAAQLAVGKVSAVSCQGNVSLTLRVISVAQHIDEVVCATPKENEVTGHGYVFTVEDILTVQAKQYQYSSELRAKESLVKMLLQRPSSGTWKGSTRGEATEQYWLHSDVLGEVVASWETGRIVGTGS